MKSWKQTRRRRQPIPSPDRGWTRDGTKVAAKAAVSHPGDLVETRAMRFRAIILALLAMGDIAHADEARNVPAVGSKLTYRTVSTTTIPRATLTTGEVSTNIVTAADAVSAEGFIKPRAVIIKCKEDGSDTFCKTAAERPGARYDGPLLTIPIASDIGDALAKQSAFKYAYFVLETRKFPMPGARDPYGPDLGDIGPEPSYILTNTYQCDFARLAGFLKAGATSHLTLPCDRIFERTASRDGRRPALTNRYKVLVEINYTGDDRITLPSGNWEVKKLTFKTTHDDLTDITGEAESFFSPQLGVIVKTHRAGDNASAQSTNETTSELISVEP